MKYKVESHNSSNAKIEDPCQLYKMMMIVMARMITAIVALILLNF